MILSKEQILEKKIVTEFLSPSQFQPAGVDFTVKEIHKLTSSGIIDFDNKKRKLSETKKLEFNDIGEIHLKKGCYKIIYNEYVSIPQDCIALAFPRSSLLRCGADVHCAVWDPGYHGRSESLLVVENEFGITLTKNAKVCQLIFVRLETEAKDSYSGIYKGENKGGLNENLH
jgi:dUTP pyrophosphatase